MSYTIAITGKGGVGKSSVAAATWFLDPKSYEQRIQCLRPYFFPEV